MRLDNLGGGEALDLALLFERVQVQAMPRGGLTGGPSHRPTTTTWLAQPLLTGTARQVAEEFYAPRGRVQVFRIPGPAGLGTHGRPRRASAALIAVAVATLLDPWYGNVPDCLAINSLHGLLMFLFNLAAASFPLLLGSVVSLAIAARPGVSRLTSLLKTSIKFSRPLL